MLGEVRGWVGGGEGWGRGGGVGCGETEQTLLANSSGINFGNMFFLMKYFECHSFSSEPFRSAAIKNYWLIQN